MCRQSGQWNHHVSQGSVDTVGYKWVGRVGVRSALSELGTSTIWVALIVWFCLAAEADTQDRSNALRGNACQDAPRPR
jgi:hypothetical protein